MWGKALAGWAAMLLFVVAGPAAAQAVIVGQSGPGTANLSTSEFYAGQVFTVPAGVNRIDEIAMGIQGAGRFTLVIQRPTDAGSTAYLFETPVLTNGSAAPSYTVQRYRMPIPLGVTPGEQLLLNRIIVSGDPEVALAGTDYYPQGEAWFDGIFGTMDDAYFQVGFNLPAPVPTLSEWAMILFGLALAGAAALHIQGRRRRA